MAVPWIVKVKKKKELAVFITAALKKTAWANVAVTAIDEFNKLAKANSFGVKLVVSQSPPEPDGYGGADVNLDVGGGTMTFKAMGQDFSLQVAGTQMHGHTQIVGYGDGTGKMTEVIKAFVFLPDNPTIQSGPAGSQISRPVGDPIRLTIAVHEFIHCCGLNNADHSPGSMPDIFIAQPQPSSGSKPQDDKLLLAYRQPQNLFAPPLIVAGRTTKLIKSVWD